MNKEFKYVEDRNDHHCIYGVFTVAQPRFPEVQKPGSQRKNGNYNEV